MTSTPPTTTQQTARLVDRAVGTLIDSVELACQAGAAIPSEIELAAEVLAASSWQAAPAATGGWPATTTWSRDESGTVIDHLHLVSVRFTHAVRALTDLFDEIVRLGVQPPVEVTTAVGRIHDYALGDRQVAAR